MKFLTTLVLLIGMLACCHASIMQSEIKVEGKYITLGDLFTGLPKKLAGIELLIAPEPGKSLVLNQKWVSSIARKYGIDYIPRSRHEHMKVVGASETLDMDEIESTIKTALMEKIKSETFNIKVDNPDLKVHIPRGNIADIEVKRVSVNSNQTRFQAMIAITSEGHETHSTKITGKIEHMTTVPVVNRVIQKGEIIRGEDVEWMNVSTQVINSSVIMDEDTLIGAAPKRQEIKAFQPLNKQAVAVPHLVTKNQRVTILAATPSMKITAKGKALEDGAKGGYIKVMNIDSKRVLYATVIGPQRVHIDVSQSQFSTEEFN